MCLSSPGNWVYLPARRGQSIKLSKKSKGKGNATCLKGANVCVVVCVCGCRKRHYDSQSRLLCLTTSRSSSECVASTPGAEHKLRLIKSHRGLPHFFFSSLVWQAEERLPTYIKARLHFTPLQPAESQRRFSTFQKHNDDL